MTDALDLLANLPAPVRQALEDLVLRALVRAQDATRKHMTSKEIAVWLNMSLRTWRRMVRRDAALGALAVPLPGRSRTGRLRVRWPAWEVVEHLRGQGKKQRRKGPSE